MSEAKEFEVELTVRIPVRSENPAGAFYKACADVGLKADRIVRTSIEEVRTLTVQREVAA